MPLQPESKRLIVRCSLSAFLVAVTLLCTGPAFRDNDQAALVSGTLQLLRGQMSPFHAFFYNYDKQWGSYLLLWGWAALTPRIDPVLRGNVLQVGLLLGAMSVCLFGPLRRMRVAAWIYLPVFLSPALVLYLPFLATASLSLAFLFLAFALLRARHVSWAVAAVFAAAACRGDVVLLAPAMILSSVPRGPLLSLWRSRTAWLISSGAVMPLIVGKLVSARQFGDLAGFSFQPATIAGFAVFALGVGPLFLLAALAAVLMRTKMWFYWGELCAILIPFAFYGSQLYSPRYFFLPLMALLFCGASRRGTLLLRSVPQWLQSGAIALTLVPWLTGLSLPDLRSPHLTITDATTFPTADGMFPMGAYAAFSIKAARNGLRIDHNQKIWEAARTVNYRVCEDTVPVMSTPMSYYEDVAIRLQNKMPARVVDLRQAPCGGAYADLRAILRHDSEGMDVAQSDIEIASSRPELGRPIVWLWKDRTPSEFSREIRDLPRHLGGRDAEVFVNVSEPQAEAGIIHLDGAWARTVFPVYMNK